MTRVVWRARRRVSQLIMSGCAQFVVLTVMAMLFYRGFTVTEPAVCNYSFSANVLSELGMSEIPSGQSNTALRVLFTIALTLASAGLEPLPLPISRLSLRASAYSFQMFRGEAGSVVGCLRAWVEPGSATHP